MRQVAANVILVSLAVAATTRDGFEKFDNPRFLTFESAPSESEIKKDIVSFKWISEDSTVSSAEKIETLTSESVAPTPETKADVNFDFELLLKEIKMCRQSFPNMSDRKFSFKLYGLLLSELTKASNKTSIHSFCNISQELLDGLRETLHNLEVFQSDLLSSDSTESPNPMPNSEQTNDPEGIYSQRNFVRVEVENNLNFKLGEEWIPLQHKMNQMSHIYLGSSLFPLFTEESRIIDKYHTLPSPSTTKRTDVPSVRTYKLSTTAEKVHRLLSPLRWHIKSRKARRLGRSLEWHRKTPPELETEEEKPIPRTKSNCKARTGFPKATSRSSNGGKAAGTRGSAETQPGQRETKKFVASWREDLQRIFNISMLFD